MKSLPFASAICAAVLAATFLVSRAQAQTGVDLLENGGFEYMATGLANGNNLKDVPTGWTVTAGEANWQQGAATGTGFSSANLAPYTGPYSGGATTTTYNSNTDTAGNHFFDGTVNNSADYTIITQTFTLSAPTTLTGSFALGVRDAGGSEAGTAANAAHTSRIDIFNSSNVDVATVYGDTLTVPATGATNAGWEVNQYSVPTLAAGLYTFQVSLYDTQNIDAITLVPEPGTWALLGVGAGLMGLTLRRRATRV